MTDAQVEAGKKYNAGAIHAAKQELLGPVEQERLLKSPQWTRLVVNELIRRIVNLRTALAAAQAEAPVGLDQVQVQVLIADTAKTERREGFAAGIEAAAKVEPEPDVACVADAKNVFQEGYSVGFNDCVARFRSAILALRPAAPSEEDVAREIYDARCCHKSDLEAARAVLALLRRGKE